jgi:folliculin
MSITADARCLIVLYSILYPNITKMNAIIALCHFCDHHGPTTIFCTQAFKYTDCDSHQAYQNVNLESLSPPDSQMTMTATTLALPTLKEKINSTTTPLSQHTHETNSPTAGTLNKSSTCIACRAFNRNFHHYISYDSPATTTSTDSTAACDEEKICYISQSTPNDTEVFALVRKACLRTLHCEVFEDPIYFDDDKNGSVIGYEFNIKDCEGRGFQRSYSLLIIMKDRIYLQHLWSFLSRQMAIIASNIKLEAERKFESDMRDKGLASFLLSKSETGASPPVEDTAEFFSSRNTSNRENIYAKKRQSKQVRGLIELTDDEHIFAKLHMWFTWILRMSSCQIREELVHGPVSEDMLVKNERDEFKSELEAQYGKRNGCNGDDYQEHASPPQLLIQSSDLGRVLISNQNDSVLSSLTVDNLRHLIKVKCPFKTIRIGKAMALLKEEGYAKNGILKLLLLRH